MLSKRIIELLVGLFMLAGMLAMFALAFKVSGFSQYSSGDSFHVTAVFDNIGDLKVRAPITIAGVRVGEVDSINIDSQDFKAKVGLRIDKRQDKLPADTTAKILTAGLIGANYIELIPGYAETNLKDGTVIIDTQPAIVLENLIGQLMYKLGNGKK
jgi:phospholipid/cholesterol/gamma-HCH transport system substrate-binding protein